MGKTMSASLFDADRNTHLKIVVIALIAAIAVAIVGIKAHVANTKSLAYENSGRVIKAGQPAKYTIQDGSLIR